MNLAFSASSGSLQTSTSSEGFRRSESFEGSERFGSFGGLGVRSGKPFEGFSEVLRGFF